MEKTNDRPSEWPVVLTIHGIRTTGDWQRELTDVLTRHRFRHVPLGFGFFKAVSLLMPWSRARKVEWFRKVYSDTFAGSERPPSVVAHSFGSYIVTKAMLKYDDIRFDKVILCGSIVSRKYPWSTVLTGRGQANAVLNEAGGRDMWAGLVEWVVADAGSSGVTGFEDTADGRLTQLIHEQHEHSDYFYRQNFEKRWIPFLSGEPVQKPIPAGDGGPNWKFRVTATVVLVAIAIAAALAMPDSLRERIRDAFDSRQPDTSAAMGSVAATAHGRDDTREDSETSSVAGPAPPVSDASTTPAAAAATGGEAVRTEIPEQLASNAPSVAVERLHRYLLGEWIQEIRLPDKSETMTTGQCVRKHSASTLLKFDRIGEKGESVLGKWDQTIVTHIEYVANTDESGDSIDGRDERKACLGGKAPAAATETSYERGRFEVFSENDPTSSQYDALLTIEECMLIDKDCPAKLYGERDMVVLDRISDTRLRIGNSMFVKQSQSSP